MTIEIKDYDQPSLRHVEPILAVCDISETISYWHKVLGFPDNWVWGDPPNHGGVSWHGAFLQFSLDPERAKLCKGMSVWINARHLEKLYEFHQKQQVKIVSPLENKPWGLAEYTVEEINGYYLRFSAHPVTKKPGMETMPHTVRVVAKTPTISAYKDLVSAVGWAAAEDHTIAEQFRSAVLILTAEEIATGSTVGCVFLLGDNITFYYIKDLIVHPQWQGNRIGTRLMEAVTSWLETNARDNATVGLFTGEHLAPFYRRFGFMQACGMYKQIQRKPSEQR